MASRRNSDTVDHSEDLYSEGWRNARRLLRILIPLLLAISFVIQTSRARRTTSITIDETFYLSCALQSIHDGWLDKRLSDSGVGALPITIWGLPVAAAYPKMNRPEAWEGKLEDPPINAWSRWWNSVLVGLPLIFLVYAWLYRMHGLLAATLGGTLVAFSPSILAHTSLATTDACFALFGILAIATVVWYQKSPNWTRFVVLGASIGIAMSAKYSGVFLFPTVALLWLMRLWPQSMGSKIYRAFTVTRGTCGRLILLGFIAVFVLWGTDWFSFTGPLKFISLERTPSDSPWIKILGDGPRARWIMDVAHRKLYRPSIVGSLIARYLHERDGHHAYFMGEYSRMGWRYYFPCAWLFKSTLAELALSIAIVPLALGVIYRRFAGETEEQRVRQIVWIVSGSVFWVLVCASHVNTGHRYLLILYPLCFLLGIDLLWQSLKRQRRLILVVAAVLMLCQTWSSISISPHYLAYFSPLIGGASQGRYYLGDSNIDWGQDLPQLKREIQRLGYQRPLLDYFGTANLKAYGVEATKFREADYDDLDDFDVLALSLSRWNGSYLMPEDPFSEFRKREFVGSAGYSILLFDLREPGALEDLRDAYQRYPRYKHNASPNQTGKGIPESAKE